MKLYLAWFFPALLGTCHFTAGCGAGYEPAGSQQQVYTADAGTGGDGLFFNGQDTESTNATYSLTGPATNTQIGEALFEFDLGAEPDASADVFAEVTVAPQEDATSYPDMSPDLGATIDDSWPADTGTTADAAADDAGGTQPDAAAAAGADTSDGGSIEEVVELPQLPDYVIENVVIPETVMMGETIDVSVVVENIGPVGGAAEFLWCKVILSLDAQPDTFDDDFWLMGDGVVDVFGPVAAGESADGTHNFEIFPWDDFNAPGTYYVFVQIQWLDEEEVSTENNVYQHQDTLVVTEFEGQSVTIETYPTADPDTVGTIVQIHRSDGGYVPYFWGAIEAQDNGYERWVGELPPGTYYVEVASYGWNGFGAYSIMYYTGEEPEPVFGAEGFDEDDPDSYEPDDDVDHATELPLGVQQNHTLTISPHPANYYDWFEIVVE